MSDFKPGQREKRYISGRVDDSKAAFTDTYMGRYFIIIGNKTEEQDAGQPGDDVVLCFPKKSYRRNTGPAISLTNLTYLELQTLRKLFDLAFEWAEPIVQERDRVAQDAFDQGDDSFERLYRRVPNLVIRKRPKRENSDGVRERPESLPQGSGGGEDSDGGVRGTSLGLAESDESKGSTQDDDQKANEY